MSNHPLNLFVRFLLEASAIITFGIWGYLQSDTWMRILLAVGLPLLFAILWGVFAVRNDPSRSGRTVVSTPGLLRIVIELVLLGGAAWMIIDLDYLLLGLVFGTVALLHYIISYDRILWLLKQK